MDIFKYWYGDGSKKCLECGEEMYENEGAVRCEPCAGKVNIPNIYTSDKVIFDREDNLNEGFEK